MTARTPGAYEGEIERYIKALAEERMAQLSHPVLGAVQIEELEVLPGRRNLMITVPGVSDEARLVYICHMDTVTLGCHRARPRLSPPSCAQARRR